MATALSDWLNSRDGGVAITGASGWVGGAMAHVAIEAGARRLRLFGSQTRTVEIAGRPVVVEPLNGAPALGDGEWLVAHAAVSGPTRGTDPEALRALNDAMLADVLALAGTGRVHRLVHASSGAIYNPPDRGSAQVQAYRHLKCDQETLVRAWSRKTGVPILLPRIFNLGGPYITHARNYALGDFILQARETGRVAIGAARPVLRSYVHVLELARVAFALALDHNAPEAFDTAGLAAVELGELAEAVGRALDIPALEIIRPDLETDAADRYLGDGAVFQQTLARLGATPAGLEQTIRDTAAWMEA